MKIVEGTFPKKREKCKSKHNAANTKIIVQSMAAYYFLNLRSPFSEFFLVSLYETK